jgi:hypothetical protein
MPALHVQTSWLRVQPPADGRTCAWCRHWAGRVVPAEMRDVFLEQHDPEVCGAGLEPVEARLDAEDPSCAWA